MYLTQPMELSAAYIRATGTLWTKNIEMMQILVDAGFRSQCRIMGIPMGDAMRSGAAAPEPAKKTAPKVTATKVDASPRVVPMAPKPVASDVPVPAPLASVAAVPQKAPEHIQTPQNQTKPKKPEPKSSAAQPALKTKATPPAKPAARGTAAKPALAVKASPAAPSAPAQPVKPAQAKPAEVKTVQAKTVSAKAPEAREAQAPLATPAPAAVTSPAGKPAPKARARRARPPAKPAQTKPAAPKS